MKFRAKSYWQVKTRWTIYRTEILAT